MKYADLLTKYRAGAIEDTDLEGVSAEDWMAVRQEAGDGLLRYALTDAAYASPDGLKVGDMVSWDSSGGRARGKIERVERDGTIDVPNANVKVKGTEGDPAALIQLYRDGEPTETRVAHKFSTLTKTGAASYGMGDYEDKDKKKRRPRYSYVLVSDDLIPPMNDRVQANAWDLREFKYRGSNLLYDHNVQEARPPIGKVENLQRGVEMKRGGRKFKALTGDVSFVDAEMYEFAGMIEALVASGHLTNGSVGFDIEKMRAPTDDEQQQLGMKKYSAVIQKANLIEFSITPLGRDKNAQKMSIDSRDSLEQRLAEFAQAGVYADETLGSFRESLARQIDEPTRVMVPVLGLEDSSEEAPALEVESPVISNDAPTTLGMVQQSYGEEVSAMREQLEALRAEVADLRAQLADQADDQATDLYDLVFDAISDEHATPTTDEALSGDASEVDPYDLIAETLGLKP